MGGKAYNDDLLVRYLLGQLSEEEQSQVEERFINDGEYYERLLIIEDELRCAYAKGALPPAERELFKNRFLIFPDERKKVELAGAMISELSTIALEEAAEPLRAHGEKRNWRERLQAIFDFRSAGMRLAMAAAALVILAAFAWMAIETSRLRNRVAELEASQKAREQEIAQQSDEGRSRLEQLGRELEEERNRRALLEQELAQMREPPSAGGDAGLSIVSLILAPGRIRGGGETKRLTIRQDLSQVRLLLNIGERSAYRSYQALILNSEGAQVWSREALRANKGQGAQFVALRIPARLLAEDDYEINLKGLTQTGELERVGDYYFTVLRTR
ncbi:MAG: hypothetical protein L0229_03295 [Blastocatellia bacterium]|nr:hypothetical protein [Blastocatellia bacterium]